MRRREIEPTLSRESSALRPRLSSRANGARSAVNPTRGLLLWVRLNATGRPEIHTRGGYFRASVNNSVESWEFSTARRACRRVARASLTEEEIDRRESVAKSLPANAAANFSLKLSARSPLFVFFFVYFMFCFTFYVERVRVVAGALVHFKGKTIAFINYRAEIVTYVRCVRRCRRCRYAELIKF